MKYRIYQRIDGVVHLLYKDLTLIAARAMMKQYEGVKNVWVSGPALILPGGYVDDTN